jgi:hypothetical protein
MATPAPKTSREALFLGLAVGGVLLAILVAALFFWDDLLPDAESEAQDDRRDESAEIAAAKTAIQVRAPESAQITFGKIKVNWIGTDSAVCGEVNIDEPDDSLDGPERFVFLERGLTLESEDGSDAVAEKWREVCDG